jgi:hypothetical protein
LRPGFVFSGFRVFGLHESRSCAVSMRRRSRVTRMCLACRLIFGCAGGPTWKACPPKPVSTHRILTRSVTCPATMASILLYVLVLLTPHPKGSEHFCCGQGGGGTVRKALDSPHSCSSTWSTLKTIWTSNFSAPRARAPSASPPSAPHPLCLHRPLAGCGAVGGAVPPHRKGFPHLYLVAVKPEEMSKLSRICGRNHRFSRNRSQNTGAPRSTFANNLLRVFAGCFIDCSSLEGRISSLGGAASKMCGYQSAP